MNKLQHKIAIASIDNTTLFYAKELALELQLSVVNLGQCSQPFLLTVTPEGLELRENQTKKTAPIRVDFLAPELCYRIKHSGGKKQLLAKAIGIKSGKKPTILDTTAGLGIDAFILATLGCEVMMLERSPIMHLLLKDGLDRLNNTHEKKSLKISLLLTDAYNYINQLLENDLEKPDVIYLDPMYPERRKTALNKKAMRVLHEIVGQDQDAEELLKVALRSAKKRVVVKRPRHAENLGGLKPTFAMTANGSCRYDIYLPSNN